MTEPMNPTEIDREIRRFLADTFLFGRTEHLTDQVSLMGNVIDSTGAIELVTFIQDRFAITVEDSDVIPENFDSLKNIVAYVERKLQIKN
jgi:acyl carrier protein